MSFNNIKSKTQAQKGFTIVELLIVVVVIAILAAITIVSYNGITNRANASAAKSTAATLQKKAELYQSENGRYPIALTELSSDTSQSWYVPATSFGSADPVTTAGSAQQGTKYVKVQACKSGTGALTASNIIGFRVTFYEYDKSTPGPTNIDLGQGCSVAANVSNLN